MSEQHPDSIASDSENTPFEIIKTINNGTETRVTKAPEGEGYDITAIHRTTRVEADGSESAVTSTASVRIPSRADIEDAMKALVLIVENPEELSLEPSPELKQVAAEHPALVDAIMDAVQQGMTASFQRQEVQTKASERRQVVFSIVLTLVSILIGWLLSLIGTPNTILHFFQH